MGACRDITLGKERVGWPHGAIVQLSEAKK